MRQGGAIPDDDPGEDGRRISRKFVEGKIITVFAPSDGRS